MVDMVIFLLRYSEVALKSPPVRRLFERRIAGNLKKRLSKKGISSAISWSNGRIFFSVDDSNQSGAESEVKKTFGVVSYSIAYEAEKDVNAIWAVIKKNLSEKIKKGESFAVKAIRGDKRFPITSPQLAALLGSLIHEEFKISVDLKNPKTTVWVEIRGGSAFVYSEKHTAVGGMPYGTAGRLCVMADGVDSIVAAWLMMRRGCEIVVCHESDKKSAQHTYEVLSRWEGIGRPADLQKGNVDCLGGDKGW
jgi:tRNA uracil 4-sulfurtransferase